MAARSPRTVWITLGGALLIGLVGSAAPAAAQEPDGAEVYRANCAQCHQATGTGVPGLFPPLQGNDNVQDTEYVQGVIRNGLAGEIVVNGETYDGQMPAVALSDAEIDAVIAFVQTDLQEEAAPTETTAAPSDEDQEVVLAFAEAAAAGRALFGGWQRLENGGPACVSCHSAGGFTGLFGPTLGPSLEGAAAIFGGEEGLRTALAEPHADRMAALYDDDPLTATERARLAAFLVQASSEPGQGGIPDGLLLMGLGGLFLLVAYAAVFGWQRRRATGDEP